MNLLRFEDASASILPGRYRHFKGNEYEVLYVARHSETEEPMVVYRALYGDCGIWVRPAYMWNEEVVRYGEFSADRVIYGMSCGLEQFTLIPSIFRKNRMMRMRF